MGGVTGALDRDANDIGASLDGSGYGLGIPLSQQRVDLGVIKPGEVLDLEYRMWIYADIVGGAGATWGFSGPLSILPPGAAFFPGSAVEFVPTTAVAEPGSAAMMLIGLTLDAPGSIGRRRGLLRAMLAPQGGIRLSPAH